MVMITAFGETKSVHAWAKDSRCPVSACTIRNRLSGGPQLYGHWTPEEAIAGEAKCRTSRSVSAARRDLGLVLAPVNRPAKLTRSQSGILKPRFADFSKMARNRSIGGQYHTGGWTFKELGAINDLSTTACRIIYESWLKGKYDADPEILDKVPMETIPEEGEW